MCVWYVCESVKEFDLPGTDDSFQKINGKGQFGSRYDGFNIWLRNKVKQREIKFRDVFLYWRVEQDKLKLENGD